MDKNRLIADIARETGIQVDASDPILAAAVINERLLDASLADLRKLMTGAAEQLTAAKLQNEASAKQAASEVINKAADWLGTKFKDAAQEATAGMTAELRAETAKAEAASRTAMRAAWATGAIGAVALSAIAGFGIAGL